MAHVQMHQASDKGFGIGEMYAKKKMQEKELDTQASIARMQAGVNLQNKRAELDTELEKTKLHERNQYEIATKRMGFDLQLKQMGIDLDLTLQKMRNFNNVELAEFNRKTQEILSRMDNDNKQAQIVKKFQTELKLANYNAKTALYRTFVDTFGDVLQFGDPASNAVDAAVYTAWIAAFGPLFTMLKMDYSVDASYDTSKDTSDIRDKVEVKDGNQKDPELERLKQELEQLQKKLKTQGSKVTRNAKPGLRTRIKMWENQRAGYGHIEKR